MSSEIEAPNCANCGAQLGAPEHRPDGIRVFRCAFCARVAEVAPTETEVVQAALAEAVAMQASMAMQAAVREPIPIVATPAARPARAAFGCLPALLFIIVMVSVFISPAMCLFRFSDDSTAAMSALRSSSAARDHLGDDIGPAWVGCQSGSSKQGGGSGVTSWTLSVSGTKGSGRYQYSGTMHNGIWTIDHAMLFVDGTATGIDVLAVVPPNATPSTPPSHAAPVAPAAGGSAHGHPGKAPPK